MVCGGKPARNSGEYPENVVVDRLAEQHNPIVMEHCGGQERTT
jgi:hypothetical protein